MDSKIKKILPITAVIGALVALASLVVLSTQRQKLLIETNETRQHTEKALLPVLELQPSTVEETPFREALIRLKDTPYVAVVWVFTPKGRILQGNRAFSQGTVETLATDEIHRILRMIPDSALNAHQRTALLAASVMQAEGEHNDIYRHLLREVYGPAGNIVAFVGVTYDVNPNIGVFPGILWIGLLAGLLLGLGAYWFSLPAWVWLDARVRGERVWVWVIFVLLGNLIALITYILVRQHPPRYDEISPDP